MTTEPLLAQRGGHGGGGGGFHGGGGGFHGGGGYSGFHNGGGYGGYRGGAAYYGGTPHYGYGNGISHGGYYGGYHGSGFYPGRGYGWASPGWGHGWGYSGWRGGWGGWGYPGFGWGGWGVSIGFNFGPFWGPAYVYPYAPPAWVAPPCYYYPSPCFASSGYASADPGSYSANSANNEGYPDNPPAEYSNAEFSNPESARYVGPSSQQLAESAIRQIPDARPEVRNAIRALSGMPPAARERELATGLFADFSREERAAVRNAVFTPPVPNVKSKALMRASAEAPAEHRREVRNAIRTLQAMPPAARQRQIESGVYSSFSPSEQLLLRNVSLSSQTRTATTSSAAQRGM